MITKELHIFDKKADVATLTQESIVNYVDAQRTIEAFEHLIVDPFKEHAKQREQSKVFDGSGLEITVNESSRDQKMSPKSIVDNLTHTVAVSVENAQAGKQMYGLRVFEDVRAIEPGTLANRIVQWQDAILGQSTTTSVDYKGKTKEISLNHLGRLATIDLAGYALAGDVTFDQASLYVTACEQIKGIKKSIIKPFEDAFKSTAPSSPDETVFGKQQYGNLVVQVKTVPREEPNYKAAVDGMHAKLTKYGSMPVGNADGKIFFANTELVVPSVYVAVKRVQNDLNTLCAKTETKTRNEVSVLYAPSQAFVLTAQPTK
ncbi:MAG: hypothetical protein ACI8Y7_000215 [Candidatus Woesearchaeota archaeon]|jgi:hypothetical protein